jgi:hypothetical protein
MEENKIPTAKEYLGWAIIGNIENPVEELKLIGFAKLHVKAALEQANLAVLEQLGHCYECGGGINIDESNTIVNSYPESNIQ